MSKAFNSPTGRLLRSSRLFSLPPPLPQPQLEKTTSTGILRSSESATLPYPIRQAITTPTSSRHRGDWGLKRALPQRSTNTSTPHIRINAIDNLAHITDFDSAADHTQNLAKWQEMNIVMLPRTSRSTVSNRTVGPPLSVFDEELDNTAFDPAADEPGGSTVNRIPRGAERAARLRALPPSKRIRWKTEGPWVAGMSEDEFQEFLEKQLNKAEFLKYVRQTREEQKRGDAIRQSREDGSYELHNQVNLDEAGTLTDREFRDYIKELRNTHSSLSSNLSRLIQDFFDLPPLVKEDGAGLGSARSTGSKIGNDMTHDLSSSGEVGPPATHASAGLSYIRTKAYMENHHLYGPQAQHSPVEARVVRPRTMATGVSDYAKLGVGGFVANDATPRGYRSRDRNQPVSVAERLFPEIEGGNKLWVHPQSAYVDESGRVHLEIQPGDKSAIEVKTGEIDPNRRPEELSASGYSTSLDRRLDEVRPPPGTRNNANFGNGLPDLNRNIRARGFDDEVKNMKPGEQSHDDFFKNLLGQSGQNGDRAAR